jgi:hypothetical protein
MNNDLETYLNAALKRLEKAEKQVLKTQGYSSEAEKLKILIELVKEQGTHENTRSSAR